MRGPSLPREEHKSGINSVRRKSGDLKKSLYTPVGPSAKKYRGKEDKKKRRGRPPPPPPPLVYHVPHNICHAIRVLHTRYIPFGREERERERGEGRRRKYGEGGGTKGPPGKKKCLRRKDEENSNKCPLTEARDHFLLRLPANIFVETNLEIEKAKSLCCPPSTAREQAAAPGTVVESMTSIPLAIII
ncbi:hypothetical protein ALC57_08154 [Trachymyrmex cornetzi]|uniref:Uncharacterized protein n=1 Tax=Trachymyrmex cornetzi TaxID=471704 RepID=A0A195E3G2_9HYME|nr:hypothetical protein ALC57_08154 [Trachymyrmex cornetzi]